MRPGPLAGAAGRRRRRAGERLAAAGELPPPRIAFFGGELAALQTAPEHRSIGLAIKVSANGHDLSQRLAKIETAIFRNKTIPWGSDSIGAFGNG
jgi:hypothetical protein